ncbi:hypothetical protein B0H13DRAFT_1865621 [Mycena leptocephala]|nr:hypothetical protein B0H13DRAFT_1865621 [Mycena leptocephala]
MLQADLLKLLWSRGGKRSLGSHYPYGLMESRSMEFIVGRDGMDPGWPSKPAYRACRMGCGADNASSNGPMNRTLVRYCARQNPQVGTARNMQIGCGGHVTNLIAQTVTATLGLAPPIAEKDLYEDTRKFSLVYDPAEDPIVVAEMEAMERDAKAGVLEKDVHDPDPSGSDLSADEDHEELWDEEIPARDQKAFSTNWNIR